MPSAEEIALYHKCNAGNDNSEAEDFSLPSQPIRSATCRLLSGAEDTPQLFIYKVIDGSPVACHNGQRTTSQQENRRWRRLISDPFLFRWDSVDQLG